MLTPSESSNPTISSTRLVTNANNKQHFKKVPQTHIHSKSQQKLSSPMAFNRAINETTCTTVTNIPCHYIEQKHAHHKKKSHSSRTENLTSCQCSAKKFNQTIPTSFLHQSLSFQKRSSNLCNTFHSLSFNNLPSTIQNDFSTISNDYQTNSNTNNEQFQLLKKQFHTYLNDIQSNILSHVIQLLSIRNQLNNEQIKDLLHDIGYSNITMNDINRIMINDEQVFINEKLKNLRIPFNDHKQMKE